MFHVNLRKSRLELLKSSGQVVTYNCLAHVESAIDDLRELQETLEDTLCQSRKVIAQTVHSVEFVLSELQIFLDHLKLEGACALTTRASFLALRVRVADYVSSYQADFVPDYRSQLASINQFDFLACRNTGFLTELRLCTSLAQIGHLVESHGGQVDYEDYETLLNSYHDQFSFVRNLIRDVKATHDLATRFLSTIGAMLRCFDHFSDRSARDVTHPEPVFKFAKSSSLLIETIRDMSISEACNFFEKRDELLERSSKNVTRRPRSFTRG